MSAKSIEKVENILKSGKLDELIGLFENETIEFKRKPYLLNSNKSKIELAKDVSALANSMGGIIVIGVATKRDPAHQEDRASELRPFGQDLFDKGKYENVLRDWLYPPLVNLTIDWFKLNGDPDKGVVGILVKTAEDLNKPVLVTKSLDHDDKISGHLFGIFERRQANVGHLTAQQLQSLVRDGRRLEREFRDGLQSIISILQDMRGIAITEAHQAKANERLLSANDKIGEAVEAVSLQDRPTYVISAVPTKELDLRELFESTGHVTKLVEQPPELRRAGFDVNAGYNSRIVKGEIRRTLIEGYKLLEVWRDGTVIFVAPGDSSGLCWSRSGQINQVFLVETTYLFCKLCENLYRSVKDKPKEIDLLIRFQRLDAGGTLPGLAGGPLTQFTFPGSARTAPEGTHQLKVRWEFEEPAARVALRLIEEVYMWFGLEIDLIPYTTESESGRLISESEIIKLDEERF